MLRSYIESRERFLHGRDSNRKSLPFEWGLEHLRELRDGDRIPEVRNSVSVPQFLDGYVSQALSDSAAFYACPPTADFEFDGHILKFPSAVNTPYPENNTVWGRFFEGNRELAVVVLPQWNCKWDGQIKLCRVLQRAGITALRLSLPYHHHRKPAYLERSEYLISPNIGRTITATRQAVLDTRRAADWLFDRGYRRVGIVGTSIGSCIGFLTFAHDERFSTAVFIHVSSFFADVVWKGLSTSHVRKSLEGAITLDQLRFLWSPISPYPFIEKLRDSDRRFLTISGRFDPTFLPELSQQTFDEFDRCAVPYSLAWIPCGHYTMGQFPFNAVAGYRLVRFLRTSASP